MIKSAYLDSLVSSTYLVGILFRGFPVNATNQAFNMFKQYNIENMADQADS